MSEYLTTKEVAELLRIKERKVYDLAAEQQIPCTRATGKLLFSRHAIDQWLSTHSSGVEQEGQHTPALFCGSHDPLLEWAIRESRCGIPTLFDGSVDGINRVLNGEAGISALHVYAPESGEWNAPVVQKQLKSESVVLVRWVVRQRGILTRSDTDVTRVKDFANHRVVTRQAGSGSQLLLEHLLKKESLAEADLNQALTARSENDLALAIAEGKADCGLGLASLALQHSLEFTPLIDEHLDLLVDRRFWFEPPMQEFIGFCQSQVFTDYVESLHGYSCNSLFDVCVNA